MSEATPLDLETITRRVRELGPWFHNMDLRGVRTAPDHFLGDYPAVKWRGFAHAIPADLQGASVLDIGCNGGFYALEMKRCGAGRVVAIDADEDYLAQARFAAEVWAAHRTTNHVLDRRGRLQLPWTRTLGTAPWALARHLGGRVHLVLLRRRRAAAYDRGTTARRARTRSPARPAARGRASLSWPGSGRRGS